MFDRFFNAKRDGREDIKKDIALLRPQLHRLKDEAEAKRVAEVKQLLLQRDAVTQQRQAEIPKLQAAANETLERETKALAAAKQATAAHQRAASELSQKTWWFDHQAETLQAKIYKLAPPCIHERQTKWRDKINEARLMVQAEERLTSRNIFGVASYIYTSNVSTVQRRIDALGEAIKSAEALKMQPLPEADIIQRLDAMEQTFPPLTNDTETIKLAAPDVSQLQRTGW